MQRIAAGASIVGFIFFYTFLPSFRKNEEWEGACIKEGRESERERKRVFFDWCNTRHVSVAYTSNLYKYVLSVCTYAQKRELPSRNVNKCERDTDESIMHGGRARILLFLYSLFLRFSKVPAIDTKGVYFSMLGGL